MPRTKRMNSTFGSTLVLKTLKFMFYDKFFHIAPRKFNFHFHKSRLICAQHEFTFKRGQLESILENIDV